jgi:hypothetical protein
MSKLSKKFTNLALNEFVTKCQTFQNKFGTKQICGRLNKNAELGRKTLNHLLHLI